MATSSACEVVRGVLEGPDAEDRIRALESEIDEAEAALAAADPQDTPIDLAEDAPRRFASSIGALSRRLAKPDPVFDREAVNALRSVIDHIVVYPKAEDGTNEVEVIGDLAALVAPRGNAWGGRA